jgi:hypothetical protein
VLVEWVNISFSSANNGLALKQIVIASPFLPTARLIEIPLSPTLFLFARCTNNYAFRCHRCFVLAESLIERQTLANKHTRRQSARFVWCERVYWIEARAQLDTSSSMHSLFTMQTNCSVGWWGNMQPTHEMLCVHLLHYCCSRVPFLRLMYFHRLQFASRLVRLQGWGRSCVRLRALRNRHHAQKSRRRASGKWNGKAVRWAGRAPREREACGWNLNCTFGHKSDIFSRLLTTRWPVKAFIWSSSRNALSDYLASSTSQKSLFSALCEVIFSFVLREVILRLLNWTI